MNRHDTSTVHGLPTNPWTEPHRSNSKSRPRRPGGLQRWSVENNHVISSSMTLCGAALTAQGFSNRTTLLTGDHWEKPMFLEVFLHGTCISVNDFSPLGQLNREKTPGFSSPHLTQQVGLGPLPWFQSRELPPAVLWTRDEKPLDPGTIETCAKLPGPTTGFWMGQHHSVWKVVGNMTFKNFGPVFRGQRSISC